MKTFMLAVAVFIAMAACDFAWTKYMMHAAAKRAHWAAFWSVAIILCGVVNVVSYTTNIWLIWPACLGAYLGTWLAVKREAVRELEEHAEHKAAVNPCAGCDKPQCWEPCGDLGKSAEHVVLAGDSVRCTLPPTGWACNRGRGHEGPCAAVPIPPLTPCKCPPATCSHGAPPNSYGELAARGEYCRRDY